MTDARHVIANTHFFKGIIIVECVVSHLSNGVTLKILRYLYTFIGTAVSCNYSLPADNGKSQPLTFDKSESSF